MPFIRVCIAVLTLLAASVSGPSAAGAQEARAYTFGVVPQQSATRLARDWVPFLSAVSKRSGIDLRFATATDIPTFEACVAAGRYDFSYMNPYHYTVFAQSPGYRALAHQRDRRLHGLIVVRADSTIQDLNGLDGMEVAFPSPAAFGASAIQRAELRNLGITITPIYVKSHDSVYRTVEAGIYVAGGGVTRTLDTAPEEVRVNLRVLHRTRDYTPHAFAAHPRVPRSAAAAVARAMADMATDEPTLAALGMVGLQSATDEHWNDVRALGLTPSDTGIQQTDNGLCPSD